MSKQWEEAKKRLMERAERELGDCPLCPARPKKKDIRVAIRADGVEVVRNRMRWAALNSRLIEAFRIELHQMVKAVARAERLASEPTDLY